MLSPIPYLSIMASEIVFSNHHSLREEIVKRVTNVVVRLQGPIIVKRRVLVQEG